MKKSPILNNFSSSLAYNKRDKLSDEKIYFAHMSVGFNIVEGINDLIKNNPAVKLNISETSNPNDYISPIFGHSRNGKNGDPKSKIDEFVNKIETGLGKKINTAILKLCYVDVTSETDVNGLYKYYTSKMDPVIKKFPKIAFIHCTVPLTTYKKRNIKEKIKDIIKSAAGSKTEKFHHIKNNLRRNQFNDLLKRHYNDKEIFDIAAFESTYYDGSREKMADNGIEYYSMIPEYTSDGGHLNEEGRKWIAGQFLFFIENHKK